MIKNRLKLIEYGFLTFLLLLLCTKPAYISLIADHSFYLTHKYQEKDSTPTDFSLNISSPSLLITIPVVVTGIGTTWNVTFIVNTNSTSSVSIHFSHRESSTHPEYWEGQEQFIVSPGTSITQFYVSHYCGDYIIRPEILANLSSLAGQASGFYMSNVTFWGYYPAIGTGHTYVSNITDWSLSYYASSSLTTTSVVSLGFRAFLIFLVVSGLYIVRKRIRSV